MKFPFVPSPVILKHHTTASRLVVFFIFMIIAVASSAQTLTTLYSFTGATDGSAPKAPLIEGTDGNFYGTTGGTIFQFVPNDTLHTLQSLAGGGSPLIQDPHGSLKLYGVGGGFFYSLVPGGSIIDLASVSGSAPLVLGTDGNFYGTTATGGANGTGSIFSVTSAGVLTTLYSFPTCLYNSPDCPDGYGPTTGVVQGSDGNFYGTTADGGIMMSGCGFDKAVPQGCGVIFMITPSGTYTPIYQLCSVQGCPEGWQPAGLVQGPDGDFYGVTQYQSPTSTIACSPTPPFVPCGSIFKVTPQGVLTVLHTFIYADGGGANTLTLATDGNFYGTTVLGGVNGLGTIFRMTPDGSLVTLYNFSGPDGSRPNALIQAANGTFYGTALSGGASSDGTIFSFSISLGGTTPSTTSLKLSPSEVTVGSTGPVVMTATVAPSSGSGTPTGAVAFFMGSTQLGISTLTNGVATFDYNPSALAINSYQLTASYVGDAAYAVSTSSAATLTVSSLPQAATPTFSPAAGTYNSPQTVILSDTTSGAIIYYTNDGTTPTTSSAVYNGSIIVNSTQTLQAIAAANGYAGSAVASATYTITQSPDYQLSVTPTTLSIVAGQSGIATFTVTPMNGFNSQVNFSCSGLPAGVTCTFDPPSVAPNGAPAISKLTVSTTASSAVVLERWPDVPPIYAIFLPGVGIMLILVARRKSQTRAAALVPIVPLLLTVALLVSCSGKTNIGGGGRGTPLGTSTVTASASTSGSGAISHSATLSITITQ